LTFLKQDLSRGQSLPRLARRYAQVEALPAGWRPLRAEDEEKTWTLLQKHLSSFQVHQILSLEQFRFWFGESRHPSVHAYVIEQDGQIEVL
jgi:hypothetical protein